MQISQVLEAVLSQVLLSRIAGGRIAAFEILLATSGVRRLIREDKVYEIPTNLEHGMSEGKQTMEQALADLVNRNIVTKEEALEKCSNPAKFNEFIH